MINPLSQFTVKPLISLRFGSLDLSLTNAGAYMLLTVAFILSVLYLSLRKERLIPSALQAIGELPCRFTQDLCEEFGGKKAMPYVSWVMSLFFFITLGNLFGLLPYAFTFTSQIIINFTLGFFVLLCVTCIGFSTHGVKFLRVFCPEGVPLWIAPLFFFIEIISYLARPVSLSIRLFANMVAGHSIIKIFAYFTTMLGILGCIPIAFNAVFIGFEVMVALMQGYVFSVLSCMYLHDALQLH